MATPGKDSKADQALSLQFDVARWTFSCAIFRNFHIALLLFAFILKFIAPHAGHFILISKCHIPEFFTCTVMMNIAFFLLHYKESWLPERCLTPILIEAGPKDLIVTIDASHNFLPSTPLDQRIVVLRTPQYNPGFSRAVNSSAFQVLQARYDFDCFLRNDALIFPGLRTGTREAFAQNIERLVDARPNILFSIKLKLFRSTCLFH